jgi:hypothetical protein
MRTIGQIKNPHLKKYHGTIGKQIKEKIEDSCQNKGKLNKKDFYLGMLHALSVVASYNNEELYKTIVNNTEVSELIAAAKEESAMEWSGLKKYGYK